MNEDGAMSKVTIYHNPNCGTSRNVLAILQDKGMEPEVIEYLKDPPLTDEQLLDAIEKHPILLTRPIVVTPLGTKLCRPSETVAGILPK